MKKLLIVFSLVLIISGCDIGTNDTLTCTSTNSSNGLTANTKYEIKYKDDSVKFVTITYDYNQDTNVNRDNTTNDNGNNTTSDNREGTDTDGTNADTDGLTEDNDVTNNGSVSSNEVIDGALGDAIDGLVDGVTDTILDLSGIRNAYENRMSSYDNIEGFSYDVDVDNDNEYKIVYKIDFDKISDSDLARFNINRDFSEVRANYENLGYTCK